MPLPILLVPGLLCKARLALLSTTARLDPPEIADGIPGARLVTIAECGHLSALERPARVTAALTEWLQA